MERKGENKIGRVVERMKERKRQGEKERDETETWRERDRQTEKKVRQRYGDLKERAREMIHSVKFLNFELGGVLQIFWIFFCTLDQIL